MPNTRREIGDNPKAKRNWLISEIYYFKKVCCGVIPLVLMKIFRKNNISYPLKGTRTRAYQLVKYTSFSYYMNDPFSQIILAKFFFRIHLQIYIMQKWTPRKIFPEIYRKFQNRWIAWDLLNTVFPLISARFQISAAPSDIGRKISAFL